MKKLLFFIIALFTIGVLISCGDGGNAPAETGDVNETVAETEAGTPEEAQLKINPDDYYKVQLFELPMGDFRDVIVDYMRKQSSIEWVCGGDFSVSEEFENWGIALEFKKGVKYTGIPYADTKVSYFQFEKSLVNDEYTTDSSKWKEVYGVQCISSIMNSIQQFDPTVAGTSNQMNPADAKNFQAQICGEYTVPAGVKRTEDIRDANGEDVIYNAYMQLQKGDIIMTRDAIKKTSHFRVLVEAPTIYKNSQGKVIPSRCSVKTIEQTNAFDSQRNDGVKTTWFVDHVYSFTKLYETKYIPLTLASYSKDRSEMEIPYIYLDKEITPAVLAKKTFSSTVASNFPLRYVEINILNKDGTEVHTAWIMDMPDTRKITLRNYAPKVFDELENGTYTMVVSAGIAIGSVELQRVEFTYTAQ